MFNPGLAMQSRTGLQVPSFPQQLNKLQFPDELAKPLES
jgi:hypothetical protein